MKRALIFWPIVVAGILLMPLVRIIAEAVSSDADAYAFGVAFYWFCLIIGGRLLAIYLTRGESKAANPPS